MNEKTAPTEPPAVDASAFEWLDVPVATCDASGRLQSANAAFLRFAALPADWHGLVLDQVLELPTGAAPTWLAMLEGGRDVSGQALAGRRPDGASWRATVGMRCVGPWRVLTLQPATPQSVRNEERLALIENFGQLGFFERDLRSGQGRWDPLIWSFWGLPAGEPSPSYFDAAAAIVAEDRGSAATALDASINAFGQSDQRFGQRFRVRGQDGVLRQVHSQWRVVAGADGLPEKAVGFMRDDTETLRFAESAGESNAQLRMAVELAGIAIWRHDRATDRILQNDQGWAMLGLAPRSEGLLAADLRQLVHPDDMAEVVRLGQLAIEGNRPVDIGARYRRSDGQWRYVLARCVAQRDLDGSLVALVGVSLDMTDRFAQTQRETELSRRLEMATSAAGVGVWSYRDDPPETLWDDQMRRLHGGHDMAASPSLGQYLREHVHPGDRESVAEGVRTLIARRSGLLDLDFRVVRPDGSTRRVASRTSCEPGGDRPTVYGVMLDVTERHEAESRLREADERIALATRGAGIGTWELSLDGEWVWWDDQMFRLRGVAPHPLPMRSEDAMQWVFRDDRDRLRQVFRVGTDMSPATTYDFRVVLPDGTLRWMASRSTVVRDELGQAVRRIGINWDITDVRATAAERQEKLLAQRESQAKSQFLARMSHELRTPLNAVLGFAQLLLTDNAVTNPQTTRERVQHIRSAGEHLLGLINEVLDLSSLESGELPVQLQTLPIAPLVHDVLPLVENLAAQHDVILTVLRTDGAVRADATRLRQVLINLLTNAIKYNRPGGVASVESRIDGDQVVLRVRDGGRGMTPRQLDRLFEPFNRLGAERDGIEGTGIGLAIVRAAVLHMGGTVQVDSEPGVGSCFEVRLPAVNPGHPRITAAEAPVAARPMFADQQSGVLYIEDNEVNMLIVAELIRRRADLVFHEAANGQAGIDIAHRHAPALILIDMHLPDMDGIEVLRRLRSDPRTAASRCVALSANAMPIDIQRALDAGFEAYWTKPLDFTTFVAALATQFGPSPSG